MGLQLQFRHDCQNLGCANTNCNLCKLSQRRRCLTNFAAKYLAPCDVVEAKCGAQIYVVVVDEATGQLVQQGLEDLAILISIIDGRKFDAEGGGEEGLERCELLTNKQGQALLAHGRSGSYTDIKRVLVPMIHGQALLPDLKITDSSEALLTGRAPPFRLAIRAVHRSGEPFRGVAFALSEPFVVATARVKGAAKLEIPHVDDHVSKIDCVGLQTQKKLEDIRAAAVAAGVPDLNLPINSVVKVGQFRELVETAECNKSLRKTLKQVLRLTKGWDVARDHVRKAVETDVQLRVYHPDGRTEVGLVFKCGSFNVIDINRPVGLMRRKQNPQQANQELVDVIWLPLDSASFPDAVKRMLPQASADWRKDSHPGWALLPLTTGHMPPYSEGGRPTAQTSSFTFTVRMGAAPPAHAPADARSPRGMPNGLGGGGNGFGGPPAPAPGMGLPGMGLGGLPGMGLPPQQQLPAGFVPGGLGGVPQPGMGGLGPLPGMQQAGLGGLSPDLLGYGGQAAPPQRPQPKPYGANGGLGDLPPGLAGLNLDPSTLQGLMQMPTLDLFGASGPPGPGNAAAATAGIGAAAAAAAAGAGGGMRGLGGTLPPELAHLLKEDSLSPFEDPNFQQLMSMVAASGPPDAAGPSSAPPGSVRGTAPTSGGSQGRGGAPKSGKRKADTSLETWMGMSKALDANDLSLPGGMPSSVAPLESLFTSMLPGDVPAGGGPPPPPVGEFPAQPSGGGGIAPASGSTRPRPPSPRAEAAAAGAGRGTQQERMPSSGAAPMDVQQPSSSSQQPQGTASWQPAASAPAAAAGASAMQADSAPAAAPAVQRAPTPAPLVQTVTLEDMQQQFARAMRQEITFAELETYLRKYNLLPSGGAGGAAGGMAAMAGMMAGAAAQQAGGGAPAASATSPVKVKDPSGGLEDMQTIEAALPQAVGQV